VRPFVGAEQASGELAATDERTGTVAVLAEGETGNSTAPDSDDLKARGPHGPRAMALAAASTELAIPASALAAKSPDYQPLPEPSRVVFSPDRARLLTIVGAVTAFVGELTLQFAPTAEWSKSLGLGLLLIGAALFGVGAIKTFLTTVRRSSEIDRFSLLQAFPPGSAALLAGVGSVVFATLLGRLWSGSVAASDLILWAISLACFTAGLVGAVPRWRPTGSQLQETGAVGALVLIFIVLNASDLNDWYYSAIGDEYAFLAAASGVLADGIRKPFNQDGVYGAHPMLGTLFQAAVMRLAGNNHFGWLFSSVLSAALAIPAVYLIGRVLGGRAVGMIAAALFGFNHYLFAFAHLGYNNVMAQTPTAWAFALFLLSWRRPGIGLLFGCGIAAGLSFYTFYSARTTIPIIGLFLILRANWRDNLSWRHWWEQLQKFWPIALGAVLAAGPIFAASGLTVITRMFNEVPGGYDASVTGPPGQKILSNFWLNIPAFWINGHVAHYISGSLMDPLSAILAALGIGVAIRWWGHAGVRFLLIWALVAIGTTALLSPHTTTAVTRLLFDIPPLAVLGALAARQLWESRPERLSLPSTGLVPMEAAASLIVVVLALNINRFWYVTPTRYHLTNDAVVVGALRSPLCQDDPARAVVVMRGLGLVRGALTSYRPEKDLPRLLPQADLKPGQLIPVGNAHCVVFGDPLEEPAKVALDELLKATPGSTVTPFRDRAGVGTVMVFTPRQQP
jgi:4-amino-4-deoxy-L-arabinose transferase-like glycosyltransferase